MFYIICIVLFLALAYETICFVRDIKAIKQHKKDSDNDDSSEKY